MKDVTEDITYKFTRLYKITIYASNGTALNHCVLADTLDEAIEKEKLWISLEEDNFKIIDSVLLYDESSFLI